MAERGDRIRVGISIGDVAGIGPELVIKTFMDERMFKYFTPIVFTNPRILSFYRKTISGAEKFQYQNTKNFENLAQNMLNVSSPWEEEFEFSPGVSTNITGKYAFLSLKAACEALDRNQIDILVTAPINKSVIHSAEFPFSGHTEYLQESFGGKESLMFMVSPMLKLGLATNHLPIADVAKNLNSNGILKKLNLMNMSLIEDFGIDKPKIAVLALNPHAGDAGLLGKEDKDIIAPAIANAQTDGILAYGPFAADAFFQQGKYCHFDAVLAMYHDQGLIPFKHIAQDEGTNYTAGLKYIRTSPDHGTAEDIAGKDIADIKPFRNAFYMAKDIYQNRFNFFENHSNKLVRTANLKSERS
jgi:4-hydroxythreonine-4-phosphate dehydrogenase